MMNEFSHMTILMCNIDNLKYKNLVIAILVNTICTCSKLSWEFVILKYVSVYPHKYKSLVRWMITHTRGIGCDVYHKYNNLENHLHYII